MWENSRYFKEEYFVVGKWKLNTAKYFPKREYLSADTETKLYYNNKLLNEEDAHKLFIDKGQKWCKENLEVRAYAFMLSDGEDFVLFQNCEDFLTACAMFSVKLVFWYNAKFDFSIIDYYMLSNGWKSGDDIIKNQKNYGKLPDKTYQSLNGDFGQRYQLRLWKKYTNRSNKQVVHNFKMIDICNIYNGGLAKNLIDFDIEDRNGNKIRKLEMDYTNASIEEDIDYLVNDTKGLYLLAEKIDKTIYDISGFSLFNNDYLTAGGLAKKTFLRYMFGNKKHTDNIKLFKKFFPMTPHEDKMYRNLSLYNGGKCLVNPYKVGVIQNGVYKYDINSMYPDKMRNMLYPLGKPKILKSYKEMSKNRIHIFKIKNLTGVLRDKMIPVWQDHITGDYTEIIREPEERLIWEEELEEISKWYIITFEMVEILEFKTAKPKGMINYIDDFYKIKCNSKGVIKNGAKLFLNSAYGKLSQRVERQKCWYEMADGGYVHLVKGEIEVEENNIMSVIVGSRVTALSRVSLMYYMRVISKNNPRKNFVYCDTDSVHSLTPYNDCDDKELGKMKFEGYFEKAIYLAPKSYLMYNGDYEVHTKGVNTKVVYNEIKDIKDFEKACEIFAPNRTFKCLCGINVKGGKALIYINKMIVNDKNIGIVNKQLDGLEEIPDITYDYYLEKGE